MSTIVLLLLGTGFVLLAFQGWRMRSAADTTSSVEGFARVLAAIDPDAKSPLGADETFEATVDHRSGQTDRG